MNPVVLGAALLVFAIVGFVGVGLLQDLRERHLAPRIAAARQALAAVLFDTEHDAAAQFPALLRIPKAELLDLVQNVAVDVGDAAQERLRGVVLDAGLAGRIRRLARRRAWRSRVQAAHLQHLLPEGYRQRSLFGDPHPLVRARAAESVPRESLFAHVDVLLRLLDDPVQSVRVAAQTALLRGDASIAEPLCEYLWSGPRPGTSLALEVAANLPDPRYGPLLVHHGGDPDPVRRAMVARALGAGYALEAKDALVALCRDEDADVRAAAASAVAAAGAVDLVGHLGRMLADEAWAVRRAAGTALDQLGAAGAVVLRSCLFAPDRYARDMARQILDGAAARQRLRPITVPEALPALDDVLGEGEVA